MRYSGLYLVGSFLFAQLLPNLGGQRVGISALSFLRIDPSPQSAGMGGIRTLLKGDAYAAYWNPGMLTRVPYFMFAASHTF